MMIWILDIVMEMSYRE